MNALKTSTGILCLLIVLAGCNNLPAPTEADITSFASSLKTINEEFMKDPKLENIQNDSIDAAFSKWDIMKADYEQINKISKTGVLYKNQYLRKLIYPRLLELSRDENLNGIYAKAMSVVNYPMDSNLTEEENQLKWAEAYKEFAAHPAVKEYMMVDDYKSTAIFGRLQFLNPKAVSETGLIHDIIALFDYEMSPYLGSTTVQVFEEANRPEMGLTKDTIEMVRQKAIKATSDAMLFYQNDTIGKNSARRAEYCEGVLAYLKGPHAKGELIDHQAPEIPFYWCSDGKTQSLADLKGKVVVLDFWATWCGPCVGSFPNIRKLQERYKDYPVAIVGVTAIQGYHYDRLNKKRIPLKDEPEKEMEMMRDFMKDFDMTWNVAFSDNEFNPDFGVRGIPHVAIIDARGVVRYNTLRPYNAPYHEAEKIDALLKEAGLAYPKRAMEQTNWAD